MRTLIFGLSLLISSMVFAKNLTYQDVESWLQTYKKVETWGKNHPESRVSLQKDNLDFSTIFSSAMEQLKGQKNYAELTSLLKKSGYETPLEWAKIGDKIILALAASEMAQFSEEDLQQQIQALEATLKDAKIPDAQKDILRDSMKQSQQAISAAAGTPKEDIAAVQKFRSELSNILDLQE